MQLSKLNRPFFFKEVMCGLTTFFAMVHAFIVIPSLLELMGVPFSEGLVTTVAVTFFGSLLLGVLADYPIAVAPSITLVAYTVYNLGLKKQLDLSTISTLTLYIGLSLVALNTLGIRQKIFESIPLPLRIGVQSGLGLFLAVIGLFNANIIEPNSIGFLAFPSQLESHHLIFFLGLLLMCLFYSLRLYGGFLLAIFITWGVSQLFHLTTVNNSHLDLSDPSFTVPTITPSILLTKRGAEEFFSLLLVVLFDTTGALYGLSLRGKYLVSSKLGYTVPRITKLFFADGCATIFAGGIGGGLPSMYLSSAAGIESGAKGGIVAITVGVLSLIPLFFLPFLSSIPLFATAAVFVIIGGSLLSSFKELPWEEPSTWLPAVVTFLTIPYTMSVSKGVGIGYLLYVVLKCATRKWSELNGWTLGIALLFLLKFTFLSFS